MPYNIVARTFQGLEEVLESEIRNLGFTEIQKFKRAVTFVGELESVYRANVALRTCLKVVVELKSFQVLNEKDVYNAVQSIDWSEYVSESGSIYVETSIQSKQFKNSLYIAQLTKDAVVDQFREKFGKRPDVKKDADIIIDVRISSENMVISLNSSGEPLFKRGYRTGSHPAPINEILAAGILYLSEWDMKTPLLDPMCGSGTIVIEAAMLALNISPNLERQEFGFRTWKNFDPGLLHKIKRELRSKKITSEVKIYASDISPDYVSETVESSVKAGVDDVLFVKQHDFFKERNAPFQGMLVFNPPYDVRLTENNIEEFYKRIGDVLKKEFTGCTAAVISGNLDALKHIGLKTSRRIPLYNGALESKLCIYQLYQGSK